ncbi:MAG TPA: LysR family transcriptional regulator [Archangium sp.]|uniref:LysR family transcriptional regulator n=1 Tax=Archangium sp. TaxID=1872627 RepID=UPI002E37311E|nr:LysR family transcriptional regulator [Archangium sp.]HEX5752983.1 LysR family transcriptional regulator [Archangium sp.]
MTIPVSPADMLLFAAVVREGSFTRAAAQLGVTKQTVSERIAKLEARLEVRLLERTTRRLRTTDAGAAYAERCAAIAVQIEEAHAELRRRQGEPVGLLRVSAPVLYGRRFLAPVLADTLVRYPKLRVELLLADRRVDLIQEGFDLAIRVGELDDSTLTARKLGEGHMYYVASPAWLAKHGMPTARTLREVRCIGVRAHETWEVGGTPVRIEPHLVVNDLEIACDAVAAGIGVARLPGLVCRDLVLAGRLRVLFSEETARVRPVYAVYPSRQYLPPKVRIFVEALARLVEPMRPLDKRPARASRR